ncbi:hypothetical protein N7455_000018 [Penicillium solitum]|uniref:uncharacterized protein n=1 Tax=Penicillium solitum TaxID=60172 RepID=UPI0032C46A9A|nr:hypothetical protein N7455_000018 [Penicillium solitum]
MSAFLASSRGNSFGVATLSLGNWISATGEHIVWNRGYHWIDLFDECWAAYLEEHGLHGKELWEPTEQNLNIARKLAAIVKSLGMRIACTQPLRKIEGIKDPVERQATLDLVAKRFPFMRAFDTDLVFMCANIRTDNGVTSDLKTVARDLAELGDMAAAYSKADGGRMLKIGSWIHTILLATGAATQHWRNRWRYSRDRSPPWPRRCPVIDRIFFFQCGDAELMNPTTFIPPTDPETPALLPWSRGHRLYPLEQSRGAYMLVELVAAAVLATGYQGPISLEVFNTSLNEPDQMVPEDHAYRGKNGLRILLETAKSMPAFWQNQVECKKAITQVIQRLQPNEYKL